MVTGLDDDSVTTSKNPSYIDSEVIEVLRYATNHTFKDGLGPLVGTAGPVRNVFSLVPLDVLPEDAEERPYVALSEPVIGFLDERDIISHSVPLSKVSHTSTDLLQGPIQPLFGLTTGAAPRFRRQSTAHSPLAHPPSQRSAVPVERSYRDPVRRKPRVGGRASGEALWLPEELARVDALLDDPIVVHAW